MKKLTFAQCCVALFAFLGGLFFTTLGLLGFFHAPSLSAAFPLVSGLACLLGGARYVYVEQQRLRWQAFERDVNATLANLRLHYPEGASRRIKL